MCSPRECVAQPHRTWPAAAGLDLTPLGPKQTNGDSYFDCHTRHTLPESLQICRCNCASSYGTGNFAQAISLLRNLRAVPTAYPCPHRQSPDMGESKNPCPGGCSPREYEAPIYCHLLYWRSTQDTDRDRYSLKDQRPKIKVSNDLIWLSESASLTVGRL